MFLVRFLADPGQFELPVAFLGVGTALLFTLLWIRISRTGIYLNKHTLHLKSWWRTRWYRRSECQRFRAEPYSGLLFVFGWPVVSGVFQSGHLIVEIDGYEHAMPGTVTSLIVARRQAESLNRWLGLSIGSGLGERRTRAAQAENEAITPTESDNTAGS